MPNPQEGLGSLITVPVSSENLPTYITDLARLLDDHIREVQRSFFTETFVEPEKLQDKMIRFADGTNWDPGSGRGLYQYVNGTWTKL